MPESDKEPHVIGNIPFLFYDVIGRMFPGGFLLLGSILSFWPLLPSGDTIACFLKDAKIADVTAGLATLVVGIALLVFAVVSSFLGFIVAPLSNVVVEKLWRKCSPYTFENMSKFLGNDNLGFIKAQFQIQFGSEPWEGSLNESSFFCAYYIWRVSPSLGAMQGRQDADLLAAQSFTLIALVLALATLVVGNWSDLGVWLRFAFFLTILAGSFLAFAYHRKKRVYGRFAMFLALSNSPHIEETQK
jgi:hypothetical protein